MQRPVLDEYHLSMKALFVRYLSGEEALIQEVAAMLDGAHDPEYCDQCGDIFCPWGEPLHFHHDGCPCCAMVEPWDQASVNRMLLKRNTQ